MIISVPSSLNFSHKSFVSRWQVTARSSSLVHLSCNMGFLEAGGDRRPFETDWDGAPDSEVEDTSTGDSRPLSLSGLTRVQSSPAGSGVEGTEEAEDSTNFSAIDYVPALIIPLFLINDIHTCCMWKMKP